MNTRRIISMICVSCMSICFSGCGSAPKEEVTHHRVGEKIQIEKLSLTINGIQRNIPIGTDEIAQAGRERIGVNILVVNEGKQALSFKIEELKVNDSKGRSYQGRPQTIGSLLATGKYLAMGDRIPGVMIYDIPKGSTGLVLSYKPAKLKNKTYLIRF